MAMFVSAGFSAFDMQQFNQFGRHRTRQCIELHALELTGMPALLFAHRLSPIFVHGKPNQAILVRH